MDRSETIKDFRSFLCENQEKLRDIAVAIKELPIDDDWIQNDEWDEIYKHKLYKLLLDVVPENMNKQTFELDGNKYRWMTFQEMEKDERIMEVNDEVVAFVKTKCY